MSRARSWRLYKRAYRSRNAGVRCSRCSSAELLTPTRCAMCLARDLERKPWLDGLRHDTGAHASMLRLARDPSSTCTLSKITLPVLQEHGFALQVDRISDRRGYSVGNMRLLACRLNRAKQGRDEAPAWAVRDLRAECGLEARPVRAFMGDHSGEAY